MRKHKMLDLRTNPILSLSKAAIAFGFLVGLSSCVTVEQEPAPCVESLPVDRFDDYMADALPPHPWYSIGKASDGVTLSLRQDGESPFCDNKETGKGLVCSDSSNTAGQDVGIYCSFTEPPQGDIYLGFDFKYDGKQGGLDLEARLVGKDDASLTLSVGEDNTLTIVDALGKATDISKLRPNSWYHLGMTIRNREKAEFRLFDFGKDRKKAIALPDVQVSVPEKLCRLEFLSSAPGPSAGSWTIDNICMAGQVDARRDANWPFKQASIAELRKSPKKVFTYYFIYGSGYSERDPGLGWYTRTVRNPTQNKKGDRKAAGTELLYGPFPRPPISDKIDHNKARQLAREEEVRLAIQQGLDGFLVDFWMDPHPKNGQAYFSSNSFMLLDAAQKLDPTFKILPAVYCNTKHNGVKGEADQDVKPEDYANSEYVKRTLAHPATLRLADGRAVFSQWLTEKHTVGWWKKVMEECKKNGTPIALVTQFNSGGKIKPFAPISYGMANWGPRTPGDFNWVKPVQDAGCKAIFPIVEQDVRTRGCGLWEAHNSELLRGLWMQAIDDKADWAFIYSWSDFSEQAMQPSTCIGFAPYDLSAYYTQWFKLGKQPEITRDVLYYFHRQHHTEVKQLKGKKWRFNSNKPAANDIELVAFLTEPGELQINIAGKVYKKDAKAGIVIFRVPIPEGKQFVPEFSVVRDGEVVVRGKSQFPIRNVVEYPNMLYCSGSITGVR